MKKGFTLVELLVVIGVLSVVGVVILTIFTRTLKGNNKAQILSSIKQNGQAVLENMDKTIRGANYIVCISQSKLTLVVFQEGKYTRFRFVAPTASDNGKIESDNPLQPADGEKADKDYFINAICSDNDPIGADSIARVLTDTNLQTGVSVENGSFDNKNPLSGFKDSITVKFQIKPALRAPSAIAGQIDPVSFITTVQLR